MLEDGPVTGRNVVDMEPIGSEIKDTEPKPRYDEEHL
jgi:hypothetical protein